MVPLVTHRHSTIFNNMIAPVPSPSPTPFPPTPGEALFFVSSHSFRLSNILGVIFSKVSQAFKKLNPIHCLHLVDCCCQADPSDAALVKSNFRCHRTRSCKHFFKLYGSAMPMVQIGQMDLCMLKEMQHVCQRHYVY